MAWTTRLAIALSILAVAVRLILIDQPYIDNWSWRQSDVVAIARNYFHNGFHFAYPQIDWAGDSSGFVGTEFPILPFLAAIGFKFAGVHDWIGRLETVILFALSLPFFFLLVRDVFGTTAAIWALIFYAFAPLDVFASREFMPDVPSLSFAIAGLYLFAHWIGHATPKAFATERSTFLLASALCISLSILIKLPNIVIAVPLACLAFQRFRKSPLRLGPAFQRLDLCLFAVLALLPSLLWYWHAAKIAQNFYPHHFFGAGGIRIMHASWYWRIVEQMMTSSFTPLLGILALGGLFLARFNVRARFFYCWLGGMILFIGVAGYGSRHQWYQLPLVPIAASFAGAACSFTGVKISNQWSKTILSILVALSFGVLSFVYVRPLYRSSAATLRELGLELRQSTPQKSLIVAADGGDPTVFYYAQRKGWHFLEKNGIYDGNPGDDQQLIVDLAQLRGRGATHLVFTSSTDWWLNEYPLFQQYVTQTGTLLKQTPAFKIFQLQPGTQ
jgi:4-amino-4-deoxy-L-arabinose transferase-like glycosyltransferase